MSKHTGKAKRIFNNMTIKRPSEKRRRHNVRLKAWVALQERKRKCADIERQNQKEYRKAA